jgi:hypothetical protein
MFDLECALEVFPQFGEAFRELEGQLGVTEDEAYCLAPGFRVPR